MSAAGRQMTSASTQHGVAPTCHDKLGLFRPRGAELGHQADRDDHRVQTRIRCYGLQRHARQRLAALTGCRAISVAEWRQHACGAAPCTPHAPATAQRTGRTPVPASSTMTRLPGQWLIEPAMMCE